MRPNDRGAPFEIVHSLTSGQVDDLMELYRHTTWAKDRDKEGVERMLRGTDLVFGAVDGETGRLCAFTRVLTDGLYRAVIFDVVVHPDYRGQGLARMIFEAMAKHPRLSRVENIILYCKGDVVGMYEKWGFVDQEGDNHLMFRGSQP